MNITFIDTINAIAAHQWNAVAGTHYPFTRHEFLSALENHGCLGEQWGWFPQHLVAYRQEQPVALVPLYIKTNSYGELVFDWAWADAYQRAGESYYPKLVSAIPYTPTTGPRLLLHPAHTFTSRDKQQLIDAVTEHAQNLNMSSMHWLFSDEAQTEWLRDAQLLIRTGCQFHWRNAGFRDFDDYLSTFSSKKRKKIKRERRFVAEENIDIQILPGNEVLESQWVTFYHLYTSTFDRKSGWATLSLPFFLDIAASMGEHIVLVLCTHQQQTIAASLSFKSADTLYGRHWGCSQQFHSLHFEACYYQGLAYCIEHGLQRFEPGAQGEHKVSRGFLPTPTYSAHWLAHPQFHQAINRYLAHETSEMQDYMAELMQHSPYKSTV